MTTKAGNNVNGFMNSLREPIHEWAIVLAGGDGVRLQELSCKVSGDCQPKQFCEFVGGKSLLAHARDRLQPLFSDENTFFVLNHAHRMYYWGEFPWACGPSWGYSGRPFPTCLQRSAASFPHPISIGSFAKSNRLSSRKTSCQRLQSVSSCCAIGLLVGRIWQPTKSQGCAPYFRCSLA